MKEGKAPLGFDSPRSIRPVLFFPIFILANVLLSYSHLGLQADLWIFLFGILVPMAAYAASASKVSSGEELLAGKRSFEPARWVWVLVLVGGIAARFFRLEDLSLWPNKDEGTYGYYALELARHWDPAFFYSPGDLPPFFPVLQGFYFKILEPSLFSLWLFPALISVATLLIAWRVVKHFMGAGPAFFLFFLMALSFWPVYSGRFCMAGVLFLFWEWLALGSLAFYLKAEGPTAPQRRVLLLGAVVGAGFYIYLAHWVALALVTALAVFWRGIDRRKYRWKEPGGFLLSAAFVLLPFLFETIRHPFARHIVELWAGGGGFDGVHQLEICGSYLMSVFWGSPTGSFCYGPFWGGLLNPLLDSFFILGVLHLWRCRRQKNAQWLSLSILLLLIPGFASHDLELMRIIMILPFLLLVTALGMEAVIGSVPGTKRVLLTGILFFLSAGVDLYHLNGPYASAWRSPGPYFRSMKSEESYNAYQLLLERSKKDGPGWLFLDFLAVPLDQTLTVASYPFNAVLDPRSKESAPTWMAFLANVNYQPFLAKRFPKAQWYLLGTALRPLDGEVLLGIVPVDTQTRAEILHWLEVQPLFQEVTRNLARQQTGQKRGELLGPFLEAASLVRGDPFLESVFWEIAYINHSADRKFAEASNDLAQILQRGYPAPHIYNELGTLLWFKGDPQYARKAFLQAVSLGGPHTLAGENLKAMENGPDH